MGENSLTFWGKVLSDVLPESDSEYSLHHIRTKAQREHLTSDPIKNIQYNSQAWSHLILLSHKEIHLLALELVIYNSTDSTTIFIAKADSTGYADISEGEGARINIRLAIEQILRVFIRVVSRSGILTRICLFARTQPQYLFRESGKNRGKHILNDRELTKWWMKVNTSLLSEFSTLNSARIHIPGFEKSDMRSFLLSDPRWEEGHIFCNGLDQAKELALCHIPHFPDDPKSRFLEFLVVEGRSETTTVGQFFLELQMRQEFLLGVVAAIIGVEGLVDSSEKHLFPSPMIDHKLYLKHHDVLISTDYSTKELARNATLQFIDGLPSEFTFKIKGTKKADIICDGNLEKRVNAQTVNVISQNLVRKRNKPQKMDSTTASTEHTNAELNLALKRLKS
ncbi:histone acetylation protein-domain-containing protein [Dipodascopsis uninucleata]